MERTAENLWTVTFLAPANQATTYKYNRNNFGFATDEQFVPDSEETKRTVEVGTEPLGVQDEVLGWRWLSEDPPHARVPDEIPDTAGERTEPFVMGVFPLDFFNDAFVDYIPPTLDRIVEGGFEYLGFAYAPAFFTNDSPLEFSFDAINTYTEEQLEDGFEHARERGLKIAISAGVETAGPDLEAFERIEASFQAEHDDDWYIRLAQIWEQAMMRTARIAEANDVEILVISNQWSIWGNKTESQKELLNELINETIKKIRTEYSGKITTAFYIEDEPFDFYKQLDWVGDKWWWSLTNTRDPSVEELVAGAERLIDEAYKPVYERYGKPIFLAQLAYASYDGAAGADQISTEAPEIGEWFPYSDAYPLDFQEQVDAYEAVFQAIFDEPFIVGVLGFSYTYWDSYDKSTGFRGKPAEEVWTRWAHILGGN